MRLLIVEDDPDGREMLAELFRMHDWQVTDVPTTSSAMDELRSGGFDVVISDENLEGESGSGMLREADREGLLTHVGVIMYTAEPGRLQVPDGVRVLRKPLGITRLLDEAKSVVHEPPEPSAEPPSSRRVRKQSVELVLYVTDSPSSRRALQNLRRVLDETHVSRVNVKVHNLADDPNVVSAEADRVAFTPVLVKREPGEPERFLGALDSTQSLTELLQELEANAPSSSQRALQDTPPPSSVAK